MTTPATVDPAAFREAMARFASGVTIVTTRDEAGVPVGFTASAFSSLSLTPPLILVCLERKADCFAAFEAAQHFAVSILGGEQGDLAMHFATKSTDKFADLPVEEGGVTGMPLFPGASVLLECAVWQRYDGGDHVIIVGEVLGAASNDNEPLLHFQRRFGRFEPR
jgi:flavin reductase ActVB